MELNHYNPTKKANVYYISIMEELKIYYTSKIAEHFPLVDQAMIFPLVTKVCFSCTPTFHFYKFYRNRILDNIIVPCSSYPELVFKWNGKEFSRRDKKSIL
jgi:hypothetical protein